MQTLFCSAYFAPISYYSRFLTAQEPMIELWENFQKQSYRTRCQIYGASGKQTLNVPIKHKGMRQLTKDTQIAYDESWQKNHLKTLETAYRTSPYFEYYEDIFSPVFTQKYDTVLDLNMAAHNVICKILGSEKTFDLTTEYFNEPVDTIDLRESFQVKNPVENNFEEYIQVFDTAGFIPDLSILDLIFNFGPKAKDYLLRCRF